MEGDVPPTPRQALDFEALSQGSRSALSAPDSPSTVSTVSCSTEGLRCFTPSMLCVCMYLT